MDHVSMGKLLKGRQMEGESLPLLTGLTYRVSGRMISLMALASIGLQALKYTRAASNME